MKKALVSVLLICLLLSLAACGGGAGADSGEELLIAAAASLEHVLEREIIPLFQARYEDIRIRGTYDSSGKLQTQIELGLSADLFFSAAMRQMEQLDEQGLVMEGTIVPLLENRLVLVAPTGAKTDVTGFADILNAQHIAIGDPESVPVGQYAQMVFEYLGIWEAVRQRASFGANVTEVLHWVAEGSADAGVVYATDARLTEQVTIIAQADLEIPVFYPVAILTATQNEDAARRFWTFLQTPEVLEIFAIHGFWIPYEGGISHGF
ncbi:MAG: molybdate ABC transporter substrate-binding protein [Oscillospiraceae bacterium]|nr:molybdate ABC transporter substrate-binding protein [Oscillospiraceae bacterium]